MAEAALYSNLDEPPFPYELVADALSWVPTYIDAQSPKRGRSLYQVRYFDALLNTVLVFARARTSALVGTADISGCQALAKRLNQILSSLPKEIGARHRIEIVERGRSDVWITCCHSPRFIWKRRLTHREVGLNLDFAAPGHIRSRRTIPVVSSRIVEVSGPIHTSIVSENIRLDYIDDRVMRSVEEFNQRKTAFFNSTMIRLKLPYRFEHFFEFAETGQHVAETMKSATPPSTEWWHRHYYFLGDLLPYRMTFCSRESRIELYWPVIKQVYDFQRTLDESLTQIPPEFSEDLENIFTLVYRNTQPYIFHSTNPTSASSSTPLSPTELQEHISALLRNLVIDIEQLIRNFSCGTVDKDIQRSGLYCLLSVMSE